MSEIGGRQQAELAEPCGVGKHSERSDDTARGVSSGRAQRGRVMTQTVENPVVTPTATTATLLQRVILPRAGDPMAVRALYLDEHTGIRLATVPALPGMPPRQEMPLAGIASTGRRLRVLSRISAVVPEQSEVSFAAYFNAFAAGYWRHWSTLTAVRLRLTLRGSGRVDVYRTKADGSPIYVRGVVLERPGEHAVDLELDLRPFEDGGWYWFDLTTDDGDLTMVEGGWYADEPGRGRAAVAIGMPTFNRPADCVATLTAIGEDPLVLASVVAVILPDQGTQKVRDAAGFEQAAAVLGDKLRIVDQPNLGGSGGYARVMYEALGTDCEQILYMDDDILLEPDSVLRAVAFSRYSREPMLVGGQMLSLQARSQLSTMGEVVDRHTFLWRNAPGTEPHHDLAERPLRQTRWLHRRTDVDYNAWWMCLIPRVGRRGRRHAAAAVHQVGRRGVRPARAVQGLPHGHRAGHRDLAHVVPGEGRHERLAGLLPLPQPLRRRSAARPRPARARCWPTRSSAPCATCCCWSTRRWRCRRWRCAISSRVPRRCSRRCRWCWGRSGPSAPSSTTAVRSTRPPRCRTRRSTHSPPRCSPSRPRGRWRSRRASPAACCTTCAPPIRRSTTCRSATCPRGRRSGSCCRGWIRPRCRRPTGAASRSGVAIR